jgi:HEAT repeat protein
MKLPGTFNRIVTLLKDRDPEVRLSCVRALENFEFETIYPHLLWNIYDPDEKVADAIRNIIIRGKPEQFPLNSKNIIPYLLEREKRSLVQHIIDELPYSSITYATPMIQYLGELGIHDAIIPILRYLEEFANIIVPSSETGLKQTWSKVRAQRYFKSLAEVAGKAIGLLNPQPNELKPWINNRNRYFRQALLELLRWLPPSTELIEILTSLIEDPDPEIQQKAIDLLGFTKSPLAIIGIVKSFQPYRPELMLKSLRALVILDPDRFGGISYRNWPEIYIALTPTERNEVIPQILENLTNWNEKIRHSAEEILRSIVDLTFLPPLAQLIQRQEAFIKSSIIRIFKAWRQPVTIPVILREFFFTDWTTHEELMGALESIDSERFLGKSKIQAFKLLTKIEQATIRNIYASLPVKDRNENVQYLMALIPDPDNEEILLECLLNSNFNISAAAIQTLGELRSTKAVPVLIEMLEKSHQAVKLSIIQALGKIGHAAAISPLIECFRVNDSYLNRAIVSALNILPVHYVVKELVARITDESWQIRQGVAYTFGILGNFFEEMHVRTGTILKQLARDPVQMVSKVAIFALGEIQTPESLEQLRSLMDENDPGTHQTVLLSLGKFSQSHVYDLFKDQLHSTDERIKQTAAIQLGKFGSIEALGELQRIIFEPGSSMRQTAIQSVGMIPSIKAMQLLLRIIEIGEAQLIEPAITAVNNLLSLCPMIALPPLHAYYRQRMRPIPDSFHLYEILPSLNGYQLFQFPSLEPAKLLEDWGVHHPPIALQVIEAFGIEMVPYIERYIENNANIEDNRILTQLLHRLNQTGKVSGKHGFEFLL